MRRLEIPSPTLRVAMDASDASPSRSLWLRLALLAALAGGVALAGWQFGDALSLEALAAHERALLSLGRQHTALIVGGLFALYVTVTASSVPAATALTLLTAWLFRHLFGPVTGYAAAVALVGFAGSAGATVAFLLSRYLLRDAILRRYGDRAARFDAALRRDGAFYLLTLRLTPFVPFWMVNLLMGLTPIRTRTFWWVGQIGMLPATCIFVFAGYQVPTLAELERQGVWDMLWPGPIVALSVLALLPLAARWAATRLGFVAAQTA